MEEINITSFIVKYTIVWKIKDFSGILGMIKTGEKIDSPIFFIKTNPEFKFKIWMYPKGEEEESKECIGFYLISDNNAAIEVEYTFFLLDNKNKKNHEFNGKGIFNQNNDGWGKRNFVQISELLQKKNELIEDDILKFLCEIKINMTSVCNKQPSDVKFCFNNGDQYHAHKNILAASTTVFADMFERYKKVDVIKIEDIDSNAFNAMLQFIYFKEIILGKSTMMDILTAADKYAMEELKNLSEIELCEDITIHNFCKYLHLANFRNLNKLKIKVIDFFKSNRNEIIKETKFVQNLLDLPKDMTIEVFKILTSADYIA